MNSLCLWFPFILLHSGAPKQIFLGGARENWFFFSELTFWIFPASFQVYWKMSVIVWEKNYLVYSTFSQYSDLKSQWCLGAAGCLFLAWALQCSATLLLGKDESYVMYQICHGCNYLRNHCRAFFIARNRAIMFWPQQIFKQGKKKSRSVLAFSCATDCYGNPIAKSFPIWKPGQLLFLKP